MSEIHAQLALPLALRDGDEPAAIIIGSANAAAIDALADPSCWPFGTAILSGPPRSGKSTLARWFAADAQGSAVVIDDADAMDETVLFHRWNAAREAQSPFLMTISDREWVVALPDLRSRLSAALSLTIGQPDHALATQLLERHAAMRGLPLGQGAMEYLIPRIERSFAGIEDIAASIDRISLERKAPPTLAVWRAAVAAAQNPDGEVEEWREQPRLL